MTTKLPVYGKEGGTAGEAFYRSETGEEIVAGGGGGGGKIDYGILFMSDRGLITQNSLNYFYNGGMEQYLYYGVQNGDYNNCLVNFVGYNPSTGVEVERFDGVRLTSEADMYIFMQNNFANDGTNYTNIIKAYIYDEIDSEIPSINKVNGMNAFFSALVGKHNYKKGTPYLIDTSNNYGNFANWVQTAIRIMTPHTTYNYNPADEPRKVIWRPSNHRTLYGLINADGVINNNRGARLSVNSSLNFVNVGGEYSVKHNNSYYCILDLTTLNFQFRHKSDFKDVIKFIGDPNYSVIVCYQVKYGNNYSIYIKPVGIDTIHTDYIDADKYTLEVLHHARNQYTRLVPSSLWGNDMQGNVSRIIKQDWIYGGRGGMSKGGYREKPYTNFILRDKVTKKISLKSKATVKRRSGRDTPLYATVNY